MRHFILFAKKKKETPKPYISDGKMLLMKLNFENLLKQFLKIQSFCQINNKPKV